MQPIAPKTGPQAPAPTTGTGGLSASAGGDFFAILQGIGAGLSGPTGRPQASPVALAGAKANRGQTEIATQAQELGDPSGLLAGLAGTTPVPPEPLMSSGSAALPQEPATAVAAETVPPASVPAVTHSQADTGEVAADQPASLTALPGQQSAEPNGGLAGSNPTMRDDPVATSGANHKPVARTSGDPTSNNADAKALVGEALALTPDRMGVSTAAAEQVSAAQQAPLGSAVPPAQLGVVGQRLPNPLSSRAAALTHQGDAKRVLNPSNPTGLVAGLKAYAPAGKGHGVAPQPMAELPATPLQPVATELADSLPGDDTLQRFGGAQEASLNGGDAPRPTAEAAAPPPRPALSFRAAPNEVSLVVARAATNGVERVQIQLDPQHLGEVEVALEFHPSGNLRVAVTSERADTSEILAQQRQALMQALERAGFGEAQIDLSFRDRPAAERQLAETNGFAPGASASEQGTPEASQSTDRIVHPTRLLDMEA